MAVAANGQAGVGPVPADAADQAAKVVEDLFSGRCLARPQQHRHRPPRRRVVDMDRQEAALTVVAVVQGKFLMPVHDIGRIVDVEGNGGRWAGITGAIEVDHGVGHAHHLAQARCVFPA
jgi:hypothetical protein